MVNELLQKNGCTAEQVLECLIKKKLITSEALQSIVEAQKEDAFPLMKVGYYAFDGYLFSPNPNAYKKRQGVVVWVNPNKNAPRGQRGLVMVPKLFPFSVTGHNGKETGASNFEDGYANTYELLSHKRQYGVQYYGAELVLEYTYNGIEKGQLFVPAVGQLARMVKEKNKINRALASIKAQPLKDVLVSSTVQSPCNMYACMSGAGQIVAVSKEIQGVIRGVFAV